MLKIKNIGKNFGGVKAVDDLSFNVDKGEIVGLIGPNGSGKSTTINLICGVFPVDLGNISVDDQNISSLPTHERVASGISRTFQNIRLFKDLSVWQNIWVALQQDSDQSSGWMQEWFGNSKLQKEKIKEILVFSSQNQFAGPPAQGVSEPGHQCPVLVHCSLRVLDSNSGVQWNTWCP